MKSSVWVTMDGSSNSVDAKEALDVVAANDVRSNGVDKAGEQKMSIAAAVAAINSGSNGKSKQFQSNTEGGQMQRPTGNVDESFSAQTSPSQRPPKFTVPETPMWRFVAKAKKTEGYSSGAAGTVVKGLSAEELAGKYKAPEWNESKKEDGESPDVSTFLDLESKEKKDRQVGKLDLSGLDGNDAVEETFEYYIRRPKIGNEAEEGGAAEEEKEQPPEEEDEVVVAEDNSKEQQLAEEQQDTEEESQPASTAEQDDIEVSIVETMPASDKQLDQVEMQHLSDKPLPNPDDDRSQTSRKKRCALLLLIILVVIAIILGVILGRKNDDSNDDKKASDIQAVSVESTDPTNPPTQSPTSYCPEHTKLFSVKHTGQPKASSLSIPSLFSTSNVTDTWVVLNACTREEVLRCLPCPDRLTEVEVMRLRGDGVRQRALQANDIGPAKYVASSDGLSACIPNGHEYVFELRQDEGECCGFDPDSFVMKYEDTVVMHQSTIELIFAGGDIDADKLVDGKVHFASNNSVPCLSTMPSYMPSDMPSHSTRSPTLPPTNLPSKSPTMHPTAQPTTSKPTSDPSFSPSQRPSREPTKSPSQKPSPSPSKKPVTPAPITPRPTSAKPTARPTPLPTAEPTAKPTCNNLSDEEFNLCFAIDMSGSVCNQGSGYECDLCEPELICRTADVDKGTCCNNFAEVIDFSKMIVSTLENEVNADKSYSVVGFGNSAALSSNLGSSGRTLDALDELMYLGGRTNHAEAINVCRNSLLGSSDGRKNLILLITDGDPSEPRGTPQLDAKQAADAAKSDGISIIPVMIVPQFTTIIKAPLEYLKGISSNGVVFDVSNFNLLDSLRTSLLEEVSCQV